MESFEGEDKEFVLSQGMEREPPPLLGRKLFPTQWETSMSMCLGLCAEHCLAVQTGTCLASYDPREGEWTFPFPDNRSDESCVGERPRRVFLWKGNDAVARPLPEALRQIQDVTSQEKLTNPSWKQESILRPPTSYGEVPCTFPP